MANTSNTVWVITQCTQQIKIKLLTMIFWPQHNVKGDGPLSQPVLTQAISITISFLLFSNYLRSIVYTKAAVHTKNTNFPSTFTCQKFFHGNSTANYNTSVQIKVKKSVIWTLGLVKIKFGLREWRNGPETTPEPVFGLGDWSLGEGDRSQS